MPNQDERSIPLYQEQVSVLKQDVISDRLRVTTSVEERAVLIEETVERGALQVERIAVERPVTEAPAPRQDGDTLVLCVVEERLIVEKRLFVIEEVRITRTATVEHVAISETVRTMRATVAHADVVAPAGSAIDD